MRRALVATVAAAALAGAGCPSDPRDQQKSPVVARVGSQEILASELVNALSRHGTARVTDATGRNVVARAILDEMITDRLLLQAADKAGITVRDDDVDRELRSRAEGYPADSFERLLIAEQLTPADFRDKVKDRLIEDALLRARLAQAPAITEADLHARFDKELKDQKVTEKVRARQILVRTSEEASHILDLLHHRKITFEAAAQRYSTAPDAEQGGDLGWFGKGEMPDIFDVCFNLEKGVVSDVVPSDYGFHIFQIVRSPRGAPRDVQGGPGPPRRGDHARATGRGVPEAHRRAEARDAGEDRRRRRRPRRVPAPVGAGHARGERARGRVGPRARLAAVRHRSHPARAARQGRLKMSFALAVTLAAATVGAAPTAAADAGAKDQKQSDGVVIDRIAAVVNKDIVLQSEVETMLDQMMQADPVPPGADVDKARAARKNEILDTLIAEKLLDQEVKKLRIDVTDAEVDRVVQGTMQEHHLDMDKLKIALARQGLTLPEYREGLKKQLTKMKIIQLKVKSRVQVTDQDVKAKLAQEKTLSSLDFQVHAHHILFLVPKGTDDKPALKKALAAKARIDGGEPFEKVAKEVSEDPGSKDRGGDLGVFARGEMVPAFEHAAFTATPGKVIGPVRTPFGWHLIRVDKRIPVEVKSDEAALEDIRKKLFENEVEQQFQRYVEELKRDAHIEKRI